MIREPEKPLAEKVRPQSLNEFVGQDNLIGKGKPLRELIEQKKGASMILWGPPGSGKTTLARLIGASIDAKVVEFSGVMMGVKDVRDVVAQAKAVREVYDKPTLLFVDEIHRLNKAQQDAFLPHVEAGTFMLVGATTENPSFSVISPLLSRTRVFILEPLTPDQIGKIIDQSLKDKRSFDGKVKLDKGAREFIIKATGGDARAALGAIEFAIGSKDLPLKITQDDLEKALQRRLPKYDRDGDEHYNVISAFIKSLRGSDPDAALYYLARMIESGEDPRFIARRMVIMASEDIGNADPHALTLAVSAANAVDLIGLPECELNLAHIASYLALAPKSNAAYIAIKAAHQAVNSDPGATVPLHLRNAPTNFMKDIGYGKDYKYDHNEEGAISDQRFLPDGIKGGFYHPKEIGAESRLKKRWDEIRMTRKQSKK